MALSVRWTLVVMSVTVMVSAGSVEQRPAVEKRQAPTEGDFTDRSSDGSYAFRYADRNQFHSAAANKDNVVSGRFGSRSPETGRIVQTSYSSGPRGFRARGPDIARQTDLSQVRLPYNPPVPTDSSKYDPAYDRYYDPNEDPSYKFTVRTPTQSKSETADSRGHVEGVYSYLDDVGKRHDVQYEAGAGTGFHVKSPHPDSDTYGGVFYNGPPGKPGGRPRGHSSIVLGKDGSYGFTASGPDQRRSEVSDSNGRVQGSYTYVDDKGVQRTVQYVAGPNIGYRIVNNAAAGGAAAAPSLPGSSVVVGGVGGIGGGGLVVPVPPSVLPPLQLISSSSSSSTPLPPVAFEPQDLFGPAASTSAPLPDRRRPEPPVKGFGGSGGGGGLSDEFLSPDSKLPLGSAFPEDDPALPPKKWPTTYKNKDEESFFQSFEKFDKRNPPKKGYHVVSADTTSSYGQSTTGGYGLLQPQSSTGRPIGPPDAAYGQPSRPIVVDEKYGQYGGTDYQKPKDDGVPNTFGGFPAGAVVKAHVQSLDILPFGYRVPSPSYVLEKQFGNGDDYQNSIKK
ncbi:uncharacterized protein LOC100570518 [Acyrthosiphon pisum]|uniref:Uncharacterized protein n=1 Tax=Acyrthosiphon pisum TaxID=7029 RepID=A0A8R1W4Q9_ACYPI|nr:uncharacterized protein LOC100570518 [Acyrthosiphon pisum]|eukprot:XP_003242606.1 PREDICTED: uncharacterized protein LOC100570518 [Acyrthosiphon pisum]